jgi:cytochrome c553
MRKILIVVLALSLVLSIAGIVYAGATAPGIKNTPHDVFNMGTDGGPNAEPCAMCHTPHSGSGDYPLWNRMAPGVVYEMYRSASFDMYEGNQPQAPSSLCLVCHNGIFSSLVNYPGPGSIDNPDYDFDMNDDGLWAMLGTNLTDDHPISFTYNPLLDNTQDANDFPDAIPCPATPDRMWIPDTDTGAIRYPLYGANKDQFECATCHAVHDTVDYSGKQFDGGKSVGAQVYFLRNTNVMSTMCADCHRARWEGTAGFTHTATNPLTRD